MKAFKSLPIFVLRLAQHCPSLPKLVFIKIKTCPYLPILA